MAYKKIQRIKVDRDLSVRVQVELFDEFNDICQSNFTTVSETIRQLMKKYIEENKKDNNE